MIWMLLKFVLKLVGIKVFIIIRAFLEFEHLKMENLKVILKIQHHTHLFLIEEEFVYILLIFVCLTVD